MSKSTDINKKIMVVIMLAAGIAGLVASNIYFKKPESIKFDTLLVYPDAKTFTGFKLTNQNNQTITIEDFADKWTLLFFGFASCPDICPTTLAELQKVYKQLSTHRLNKMPEVLFVSVDPDRDTPENLKNYIDFFNPMFNAASTDNANLIALTTQIGVAYHVEEHEDGSTNYNVDHSAAIYVISPEKKLYGIFPTPHNEKQITADLIKLLSQ